MDVQDVQLGEVAETYHREELEAIRAWAKDRELPGQINVEIGSNRGRFLRGLGELYPDQSVLGIEIRKRFSQSLQTELDQKGPPNAHILGADAKLALPLLFADGSISRFFVLFPDPWWKKRHAKRRLLTPSFLSLVADKVSLDGLLIIKTDVSHYAEMVEGIINSSPRWRRVKEEDEDWPSDDLRWPETSRERNIKRKRLPIWKIYAKPTGAVEDTVPEDLPAERFPKTKSGQETARPRLRR